MKALDQGRAQIISFTVLVIIFFGILFALVFGTERDYKPEGFDLKNFSVTIDDKLQAYYKISCDFVPDENKELTQYVFVSNVKIPILDSLVGYENSKNYITINKGNRLTIIIPIDKYSEKYKGTDIRKHREGKKLISSGMKVSYEIKPMMKN